MEEIEYPKEGDNLFSLSDDRKRNAVISMSRFSKSVSWFAYTDGYREAAEAVFEYADKIRMSDDLLVYPILFLWHHHIELRLKELIWRCQDLADQTKDYRFNHKLSDFWEIVKECVPKICPRYADDPATARVENIIRQLSYLNSTSHALRYPEDRQDEFGIPKDIEYINLGVLNAVMCRCANYLQSISDELSALKDNRDDERGYVTE